MRFRICLRRLTKNDYCHAYFPLYSGTVYRIRVNNLFRSIARFSIQPNRHHPVENMIVNFSFISVHVDLARIQMLHSYHNFNHLQETCFGMNHQDCIGTFMQRTSFPL